MQLAARVPSAALAPYVDRLWYFEGRDFGHAQECVMPGTAMQLLFNLQEDELRWWEGSSLSVAHRTCGAAVGGLYLAPFAIDTLEQQRVIGAVFRPGGASVVLGVPAPTLTGAHRALDSLWGAEAARLREQLLEAETAPQALALLDAALVARIGATFDPIVAHACHALERGVRIAVVASGVGLGEKRFRERFSTAVGVSPKSFARLARLQRVLTAAAVERPDWARLAQDCGYYDQAHLIQDFRVLTGMTPSAYRPRTSTQHNHVVIPG